MDLFKPQCTSEAAKKIQRILRRNPNTGPTELAAKAGVSRRYASQVKSQFLTALAAEQQELLHLEQAGQIKNIELQPRYDLTVNGHKLGFYKGDFRYEEVATGKVITEDVKSPVTRTAVYMLKKKLVKALHSVDIVEV